MLSKIPKNDYCFLYKSKVRETLTFYFLPFFCFRVVSGALGRSVDVAYKQTGKGIWFASKESYNLCTVYSGQTLHAILLLGDNSQ